MRVVGYGDNVVDRYVNKNRMFPGGNCINFAVYAKRAGAESAYLGAFGEDAEAELIRGALDKLGVSTVFVKLSERTGPCHRWGKAGSTGTGAEPGYLRLVTVRALKRPCKP